MTAIAVVAVALRLTRLGWGLDHGMPFPDEVLVWQGPLLAFLDHGVGVRSLLDQSLVYPPLFGYLAGAAVGSLHAAGWLAAPRADMLAGPLLVARAVAAACSVLSVLMTVWLGWRFYAPAVGLVAGAIMAVIPLNVMQAHYVSTDPLLNVMVVATLFASCRLRACPSSAAALVAGVAAALAFSSKYTGLVCAIAPAWVVLELAIERRSVRTLLVLGGYLSLGFLLGLLVACPPCFFRTDGLLEWLGKYAGYAKMPPQSWRNNFASPTLGWYGRPYLYQLVASLPYALGWPVYVAAACGVVIAARRRSAADRVLLVFATSLLLVVGGSSMAFPRYLSPLFPVLSLVAASGLQQLPTRAYVRGTVTTFVLAYSLALSATQVMRFSYTQQIAVADWISQRASSRPGSESTKVGIVAPSPVWAAYYGLGAPLQSRGLQSVVVTDENLPTAEVDFLVVPEWTAISAQRDEPDGALANQLSQLQRGETRWIEARRWHSGYLDDRFYRWLDPAFAGDLWQGEIGFILYEPRAGT